MQNNKGRRFPFFLFTCKHMCLYSCLFVRLIFCSRSRCSSQRMNHQKGRNELWQLHFQMKVPLSWQPKFDRKSIADILIWFGHLFIQSHFLATAFLKLVSLEDRMNMLSISFHERSQEKWYFTLKIAKVNKLGNCQDIRVINTSLCNVFRFWSQKEHASLKSCNFLWVVSMCDSGHTFLNLETTTSESSNQWICLVNYRHCLTSTLTSLSVLV